MQIFLWRNNTEVFGKWTKSCPNPWESKWEKKGYPQYVCILFLITLIFTDSFLFSLSVWFSQLMKFWLAYRLVCVCTFLFGETTWRCSASKRSHALIVKNRNENRSLPSHICVFIFWLPFIIKDLFVFSSSVWFSQLMKLWFAYRFVSVCTILFRETTQGCSASERSHALIDKNCNENRRLPSNICIYFFWLPFINKDFFRLLIICVIQQVDELVIGVSFHRSTRNKFYPSLLFL